MVAEPFRRGLREAGYVEGQNVAIEFRFAEGQADRLPQLAADLVNRKVAAIFVGGGAGTAHAVKSTTTTIPIIFANGEDPVKSGLVPTLNRPDGNLTGVTFFTIELGPKRIDLLRALAPGAGTIAILAHPRSSNVESEASVTAVQAAIRAAGLRAIVVHAATPAELAPALRSGLRRKALARCC